MRHAIKKLNPLRYLKRVRRAWSRVRLAWQVKCFEQLKEGGVMVFDDYLWKYYPREIDNPAAAINAFLWLKEGQYRVVAVYYQLVIQKLASVPVSPAAS